jgi:hypothetical protein
MLLKLFAAQCPIFQQGSRVLSYLVVPLHGALERYKAIRLGLGIAEGGCTEREC